MRVPIGSALTICVLSCGDGEPSANKHGSIMNQVDPKPSCRVDSSLIEFLPYESWLGLDQYRADSVQPITHAEIEAAECLLIDHFARGTRDASGEKLSMGLGHYWRQYCSLSDSAGHRLIYLNAICLRGPKPKRPYGGWEIIEDGGDCYFQALFDLQEEVVVFLSVNGEA